MDLKIRKSVFLFHKHVLRAVLELMHFFNYSCKKKAVQLTYWSSNFLSLAWKTKCIVMCFYIGTAIIDISYYINTQLSAIFQYFTAVDKIWRLVNTSHQKVRWFSLVCLKKFLKQPTVTLFVELQENSVLLLTSQAAELYAIGCTRH